jgi:hypothetical protein
VHTGSGKESAGNSYIPVCHDDSIVCVTFPPDPYKGTNFGAASFEVTMVNANTRRACLNPEISPEHPGRTINGVQFAHIAEVGAAMSHIGESNLYQGFKNGKCYALAIAITFTDFAVYSPPVAIKEFTNQDKEHVLLEMTRLLDSFKILR